MDLMNQERLTSRRGFLKTCVAGAAALRAGGATPLLNAVEQAAAPIKSKVVIARDAVLRGSGTTVDSARILGLLDRSMQMLFDFDHPLDAWRNLAHPGQKVGIKVNALGGRGLSSDVQLVTAICQRLQEAGIRAGDIVI